MQNKEALDDGEFEIEVINYSKGGYFNNTKELVSDLKNQNYESIKTDLFDRV